MIAMIPALALLVVILAAATLGGRLQRHRSLFGAPLRELVVLFAVITVVFMGTGVLVMLSLFMIPWMTNELDIASVSGALAAIATLGIATPVWRRLAGGSR